jgi:hypothetical protein
VPVSVTRSVYEPVRRRLDSDALGRLAPVPHRNAAARIVESNAFTVVVVATIAVNAVVLGLQTYDGAVDRWGSLLDASNAGFQSSRSA